MRSKAESPARLSESSVQILVGSQLSQGSIELLSGHNSRKNSAHNSGNKSGHNISHHSKERANSESSKRLIPETDVPVQTEE